jgi:hypothetical protein
MIVTDLGIFGPERSHEEFALLASAGMPPALVLRSATVTHIDQLGEPGKISFVMKEGKIFKDER